MIWELPVNDRRGLATLLGLYGFMFTWLGLRSHPPTDHIAWLYLAVGLFLFSLILGIAYAHEWARLTCGIASIAFAVATLAVLLPGIPKPRVLGTKPMDATVVLLFTAGVWVLMAVYCLKRSTRQAFAEARDANARSRMGPL